MMSAAYLGRLYGIHRKRRKCGLSAFIETAAAANTCWGRKGDNE